MTVKRMKDVVSLVGAVLKLDSDYWELRWNSETITSGERNETMLEDIADAVQAYFGSHPDYCEFHKEWKL